MKKRIISLLIIAVMLIGVLPQSALAAIQLPIVGLNNEAAMDGTSYSTLEQAIAAVPTGTNKTITLLKDVTRTGTGSAAIKIAMKNITLDLNGHEIKGSGYTTVISVGMGNLTVTDTSSAKNGKVTSSSLSKGAIGIAVSGLLYIENGYFYGGIGATGDEAMVLLAGGYYNMAPELLVNCADYPYYPKCFDYNMDPATMDTYPYMIVDEPVAEISYTPMDLSCTFGSLKAIMDICETAYTYSKGSYNGFTIRLLKDTTEAVTIPANVEIFLDLNSKKLGGAVTNTDAVSTITNNGVLTVNDTSSKKAGIITMNASTPSTSYSCNTITNNGKFTLKNGTIKNETTGTGNINAIETIKTGTEADLTITGGAVEGDIKINSETGVTAAISGGRFTGVPYVSGTELKFVTGGLFAADNASGHQLSSVVSNGYDVFANDDVATSTQYPYTIKSIEGKYAYIIRSGVKNYFTSLSELLDKTSPSAAQSGETIVLCNDDLTADADEFLVVRSGITLDLNGHKLKANALSVFGTLIDTTAKNVKPAGLIQVDNGMFTYSNGSKDTAYSKLVYIPAYDSAAAGYRIYAISGFSFTATKASSTAYNVTFRPNLRAGSTYYSSILAETAGVQVFVQFDITRTVGSVQTPVPLIGELTQAYKDNFVATVGTSGTALFSAALSLSEAAPSVKVTPYIISRGMTVCAQSKTPA